MALRITLTLIITIVALAIVGRRVYWLNRLIRSGRSAPGRTENLGRACGRSWWRCSVSAPC